MFPCMILWYSVYMLYCMFLQCYVSSIVRAKWRAFYLWFLLHILTFSFFVFLYLFCIWLQTVFTLFHKKVQIKCNQNWKRTVTHLLLYWSYTCVLWINTPWSISIGTVQEGCLGTWGHLYSVQFLLGKGQVFSQELSIGIIGDGKRKKIFVWGGWGGGWPLIS